MCGLRSMEFGCLGLWDWLLLPIFGLEDLRQSL